jgi:hypothetical protein
MSGCADTTVRNPSRTIGWSSTSTTRIRAVPPLSFPLIMDLPGEIMPSG